MVQTAPKRNQQHIPRPHPATHVGVAAEELESDLAFSFPKGTVVGQASACKAVGSIWRLQVYRPRTNRVREGCALQGGWEFGFIPLRKEQISN